MFFNFFSCTSHFSRNSWWFHGSISGSCRSISVGPHVSLVSTTPTSHTLIPAVWFPSRMFRRHVAVERILFIDTPWFIDNDDNAGLLYIIYMIIMTITRSHNRYPCLLWQSQHFKAARVCWSTWFTFGGHLWPRCLGSWRPPVICNAWIVGYHDIRVCQEQTIGFIRAKIWTQPRARNSSRPLSRPELFVAFFDSNSGAQKPKGIQR